ncbi:HNH endonuclease [Halorubrum ezzemoulense]|uniref:HNH endonuclease n=1 Tax=Halorubrum ezzemoulense TaxID=337243 RepID=UPI002330158A|nr:HNH endonuclease [Halorubrum ezzemoulense]MDB2238969.1 HNH endonuclease [Halorubrum ezzemoulense]MDB2249706.1 HNH endonuclease [Halorubrum ezzemoulense]
MDTNEDLQSLIHSSNKSKEEIITEIEKLTEFGLTKKEAIESIERKYGLTEASTEYVEDPPPENSLHDLKTPPDTETTSSDEDTTHLSDFQLQINNEYPENWDKLRRQAYVRDNYECKNCGVTGGIKGDVELHAHHIVPLSSNGNNTISNLATLCRTCHGLIHDHMDE